MATTITAVDNADDTGLTVTVAGAAGDTVEIFGASWAGGFASPSWVSQGSRVGNGNVTASVTAGYWWLYGINSTDTELTAIIGLRATTGTDDIVKLILDAVVSQIKALSLTGISASEVLAQKLPWNVGAVAMKSQGVMVTPVPETLVPNTNNTDRYGFGVQVTAYQSSNGSQTGNLNRLLDWRTKIADHFRMTTLSGVAATHDVTVEPGPVIDPEAFKAQFDAQTLVLRVMADRTADTT